MIPKCLLGNVPTPPRPGLRQSYKICLYDQQTHRIYSTIYVERRAGTCSIYIIYKYIQLQLEESTQGGIFLIVLLSIYFICTMDYIHTYKLGADPIWLNGKFKVTKEELNIRVYPTHKASLGYKVSRLTQSLPCFFYLFVFFKWEQIIQIYNKHRNRI